MARRPWRGQPARTGVDDLSSDQVAISSGGDGGDEHHAAKRKDNGQHGYVANHQPKDKAQPGHRHRAQHRPECDAFFELNWDADQVREAEPGHHGCREEGCCR